MNAVKRVDIGRTPEQSFEQYERKNDGDVRNEEHQRVDEEKKRV